MLGEAAWATYGENFVIQAERMLMVKQARAADAENKRQIRIAEARAAAEKARAGEIQRRIDDEKYFVETADYLVSALVRSSVHALMVDPRHNVERGLKNAVEVKGSFLEIDFQRINSINKSKIVDSALAEVNLIIGSHKKRLLMTRALVNVFSAEAASIAVKAAKAGASSNQLELVNRYVSKIVIGAGEALDKLKINRSFITGVAESSFGPLYSFRKSAKDVRRPSLSKIRSLTLGAAINDAYLAQILSSRFDKSGCFSRLSGYKGVNRLFALKSRSRDEEVPGFAFKRDSYYRLYFSVRAYWGDWFADPAESREDDTYDWLIRYLKAIRIDRLEVAQKALKPFIVKYKNAFASKDLVRLGRRQELLSFITELNSSDFARVNKHEFKMIYNRLFRRKVKTFRPYGEKFLGDLEVEIKALTREYFLNREKAGRAQEVDLAPNLSRLNSAFNIVLKNFPRSVHYGVKKIINNFLAEGFNASV